MKPTEKIEKLLETMTVTPAPQKDRQMLNAILHVQAESKQQPSAPPGPSKWRIIMHSKLTKLAAAAIIIIAVLIGINMLNGAPAWADVLEQVNKAKSVYYKCTSQTGDFSWTTEEMINQEGVIRSILNNGAIQIFDFRNGFELQLNTHSKIAYRTTRTPQPHMKLFNSLDFLSSRHEKGNAQFIGHEIVDGIKTEVYKDVQPLQFSCSTIWVDSASKLPVRVVEETTPPMDKKYLPIKDLTINSKDFGCNDNRNSSGRLSGSHTPQYRKQIKTNFKWNIDLESSLFSTEIPSGYEQHEEELPAAGPSETDLIETLRFWAEVSDRPFPTDANDLMNPDIIQPMMIKKFKKGQDPRQEYDNAQEFMTTVRWAASFAEGIIINGNWYVSPEPVSFGQADKPLYWWKLENSEMYRVIYGDLSIKEVTQDQLPIQP